MHQSHNAGHEGLKVVGETDLEQQVPVDEPCRVSESDQLQQLGQLHQKSTSAQCKSVLCYTHM